MKLPPLSSGFYRRSAAEVAPRLLGHWLIIRNADGVCGGRIVEAEAYLADDPASHSFRGRTRRNASMFAPPGTAYVYFIYGMHLCVNAVCGPEGVGEAVLIRAITSEFGLEQMAARRGRALQMENPRSLTMLTNGPGKLAQALGITREMDGLLLCAPGSPLLIARAADARSYVRRNGGIRTGPRIGISQAKDVPLRFTLGDNPFVSRNPGKGRISVSCTPPGRPGWGGEG